MPRHFTPAALSAAPLLLGAAAAAADVPADLFLTNGDAPLIQVVSGTSIVRSRDTFFRGYPLAVSDSVRLYSRDGTQGTGREYGLDLADAPGTYPWSGLATGQLLDGATDGVSRNWACEYSTGGLRGIYEYDRNWQNPRLILTKSNSITGITYDAASGTLWIINDAASITIEQITTDGFTVSSFAVDGGRYGALAYEPGAGTLWMYRNGSGNALFEYSTSGLLLQAVTVPGLSQNIWGGEFAVPAPASATALAAAGLAMFRRRR